MERADYLFGGSTMGEWVDKLHGKDRSYGFLCRLFSRKCWEKSYEFLCSKIENGSLADHFEGWASGSLAGPTGKEHNTYYLRMKEQYYPLVAKPKGYQGLNWCLTRAVFDKMCYSPWYAYWYLSICLLIPSSLQFCPIWIFGGVVVALGDACCMVRD